MHWALLGAGLGLLLAPSVRPRWVLVPLVGGIGAILALGWELGEYALFIRDGKEAGGAYRDTLGDETLGTSGALRGRAPGRVVDVGCPRRRPKKSLIG